MSKKSEERARSKALAQEKFEAQKAAFVAKVVADLQPKQVAKTLTDSSPRLAPHLARAAVVEEKNPKAIKDGSRYPCRVTWCTTKADTQDRWSWGEDRAWSPLEWDRIIYPPLRDFEGLTWQEVDQLASGTGHKMHHSHEIGDLIGEAQERWLELDLEQYDSVFRFRLGGQKRRAWGAIVQAHFYLVWWDREHSIYPTEPG